MIVGHQKQWQFLKKSAELEKIPHAYLFFGEEKLGKKTIAFEFIKLLDCQNPEFQKRPCQVCRSCQDIQKKQYPDLSIIEPIKKEIQISQIRELSWRLSLRPYSAPFKAAIIDQAHFMNQEAQNCFLKTLEEPKGKAILILITEYPEALFPTILSRCQTLKFYPLKTLEIKNYLKQKGMAKEKAEEIAKLSAGKPGEAVEFLLNPQKLEMQKQKIKELIALTHSDLATRFQCAKDLSKESNLKEILDIWLRYFRNILISTINQQSQKYGAHRRWEGGACGSSRVSSLNKLKKILKLIQKTNFLISTTNVNPRLALEILMLEL